MRAVFLAVGFLLVAAMPAAAAPPAAHVWVTTPDGTAKLDDGYRLLDPPRDPDEATDDDATTTWTGQSLDIDLGRTQRVRRVVLDTGTAIDAHPGDNTLSTSTDGVHWSEVAAGTGTGQLTTIDFPATAARHLRVALTATSTVADVRVYR